MSQVMEPVRRRPRQLGRGSAARFQVDSVVPRAPATLPASRVGLADVAILAALGVVIAMLVEGARQLTGPYRPELEISLAPSALPGYAALSTLRMLLAYLLSLAFTLIYGSAAASFRRAERVLIPALDILQSIPILSFMPGVVLAMVALFPGRNLGVELASIVLIFTSQAWNMTFSFYHSLRTLPKDLVEASRLYRLSAWQRFIKLNLPFAAIGLVWNSMMSWAGGWFFLMAAETFTLSDKDFRLPGLGSYLQAAANAGDTMAIVWGVGALVLLIVALDQLLWRPLIAWSDKFKFEMTEAGDVPRSWVLDLLERSAVLHAVSGRIGRLRSAASGRGLRVRRSQPRAVSRPGRWLGAQRVAGWAIAALVALALARGALPAFRLLSDLDGPTVLRILGDFALTQARVLGALAVGAAWTIPAGVAIGLNPRLSRVLQPVVQVAASIPATALFPVMVAVLVNVSGGVNLASILLMLLGTQWYVLFNVIAGAMAIPTDLIEAARLLKVRRWLWWRRLVLPAIFPYLVTGLLTATGGAWNASIVSEYVKFRNQTFAVEGLGATITAAASDGQFSLLLAGTVTMAIGVALINRLFWRRLYQLAEEKYRLD